VAGDAESAAASGPTGGLTEFQVEVAHVFFELPSSSGFLLAGGAALLAQQLTDRPTHDLDLFTSPGRGDVMTVVVDLEAAAGGRGWAVERIQSSATFCRIVVRRSDRELLIDVAVDAPPGRPASVTIVGPTFDREELAGRKVLALFDRAEARDFVDVYLLARHFSTELLLTRAFEIDAGFDRAIFAEMLGSLSRFSDGDIPLAGDDFDELRAFFATWRAELTE
jgi:hypothetical protein